MRKKTKNIKVRDLKPKKDAKGGAVANTTRGYAFHQGTYQGTNQGTHQGTQSQG
jgi:hypothetical protein